MFTIINEYQRYKIPPAVMVTGKVHDKLEVAYLSGCQFNCIKLKKDPSILHEMTGG